MLDIDIEYLEDKNTRTDYARYRYRISRRQEQAMLDIDTEYLEDKNRLYVGLHLSIIKRHFSIMCC